MPSGYVYSLDLMQSICDRVADGEHIKHICKEPDMPSFVTFWNWCQRDPELQALYDRAMQAKLEGMSEELLTIGDDSTNDYVTRLNFKGAQEERVVDAEHINRSRLRIETRKWLLEKRFSRIYGDKMDLNVKGSLELSVAETLRQRRQARIAQEKEQGLIEGKEEER